MPPPDAPIVGIVEDDEVMGQSLEMSLRLEGLRPRLWTCGAEALAALSEGPRPDVLVCDIRLPDMTGEALYGALPRLPSRPPVLFMTAFAEVDQAVRLMRAGAGDYVTKPFDMADFHGRLRALLPAPAERGEGALGPSRAMREIEAYLARIAGQTGPVLVTGETGTGKEVCARHLHALSHPGAPFVAVNCAAIPAELLESEIFGHEKGAFTGAQARHRGYAERAGRGTLFLDEIGEMPIALQAKILRLIEERRFARLGAETEIPFRGRIVAATNRDPEAAVASGAMRADLLYRLDTFALEIPPLRARPEDIGWLVERFVAEFAGPASPVEGVSALAQEAAAAHDWPGNAREVRNRVERAVALAREPWLMPADLFPPRRGQPVRAPAPLAEIREAAERRAIEGAIADAGGQMQEAARRLGISRTTLWEKMRRLGLSG